MVKKIPILIIITGFILLLFSLKEFLKIYGLYMQKKTKKTQVFCAAFSIFNAFVFIGIGGIWLFLIYQQLK